MDDIQTARHFGEGQATKCCSTASRTQSNSDRVHISNCWPKAPNISNEGVLPWSEFFLSDFFDTMIRYDITYCFQAITRSPG